ncbi:hypothetical protein D7Y13_02970 [Corallococcus praedator]|uniref:Ig-like domain-containing protein n=1 Tax=Corallococcus praedator TaxID=2316724 RepID=A0ABX9QPZ9_9BACT|nr:MULTISPECIES: hypothetical protein [Corallococcus]RKH33350.1 hypothetical protein D7X75_12380 [Corallococcus sp. CA031C]RKI16227.1 hypothetical protein D7Y13_02970 [Corallococcus praedator]
MKKRLKRRPSFLSRLLVSAVAGFVVGVALEAGAEPPERTGAPPPAARPPGPTVVVCLEGTPTGGNTQTTYTPGLTRTPRPVTVSTTGTFDCTLLLGGPVGTPTLTATATLSGGACPQALDPAPPQTTLTWGPNETSTLTLSAPKVEAQGPRTVQTFSGFVSSGKFSGANVVRTVTYVTADLAAGCASPSGLMSAQGSATLIFVKLF